MERKISLSLFALAIITLILSFIPVTESVNFNVYDTYYVMAHQEALWFYAGFIAVVATIIYLWHSYTDFYSQLLAWILFALMIIFLSGVVATSYFSESIGLQYGTFNLVSTYSFIAVLGLTPVYTIVKLNMMRKS